MIRDVKVSTPVEQLCENMPSQFKEFLLFARGLEFSNRPDYDFARNLFYTLYTDMGYKHEDATIFDWDEDRLAREGARAEGEKGYMDVQDDA